MEALTDIYDRRLAQGVLRPDADQRRAVEALAGFYARLGEQRPPPFWRRWFCGRGAASFPAPGGKGKQGFYFHGDVGRGKTMVMDMAFAHAPLAEKRRVHFHAFMLEVHDFLHARRRARGKGQAIDSDLIACADHIAGEARLLCFDEFQVRDVADAMILGRLFTALLDRGVAVIATSNTPPDDLYADGLQRDRFLPFIALVKERLEVMAFTGRTDYRLDRIRGLRTYFHPHDGAARAALEGIFDAVSGGAPPAPADIPVKGRVIRVPRAAKEVAWFTFAELCETHKSAVDYLALAKAYRVFIVEDVPRLHDGGRDALMRFITLVDALYDHHAHIAVSAAAPPAALYEGTEFASVFARTASRLAEMQSREYRRA